MNRFTISILFRSFTDNTIHMHSHVVVCTNKLPRHCYYFLVLGLYIFILSTENSFNEFQASGVDLAGILWQWIKLMSALCFFSKHKKAHTKLTTPKNHKNLEKANKIKRTEFKRKETKNDLLFCHSDGSSKCIHQHL